MNAIRVVFVFSAFVSGHFIMAADDIPHVQMQSPFALAGATREEQYFSLKHKLRVSRSEWDRLAEMVHIHDPHFYSRLSVHERKRLLQKISSEYGVGVAVRVTRLEDGLRIQPILDELIQQMLRTAHPVSEEQSDNLIAVIQGDALCRGFPADPSHIRPEYVLRLSRTFLNKDQVETLGKVFSAQIR